MKILNNFLQKCMWKDFKIGWIFTQVMSEKQEIDIFLDLKPHTVLLHNTVTAGESGDHYKYVFAVKAAQYHD